MSITIGQAGRSGFTIPDPQNLSWQGDVLSMDGLIDSLSSADSLLACRDVLRGVSGNIDEPVQPVVFSNDTNLTGFYTDIKVSVAQDPAGWARGFLTWSFTGTRVPDAAYAQVSSVLVGGNRTNSVAVTTGRPWYSPPPSSDISSATTHLVRGGGDASTNSTVYFDAAAGTLATARSTKSFIPDPTTWYTAGVKLERKYGSTWYPYSGRELATIPFGVVDTLRLSNGIIRATWQSNLDFVLEAWGGAAWETVISLAIAGTGIAGHGTWSSVTSYSLTKVTPWETALRMNAGRFATDVYGSTSSYVAFDFRLKRGSPIMDLVISNSDVADTRIKFTGETGTNITAGMKRSANDANGNRWIILSPNSITTSTASSAYAAVTANPAIYGIGAIVDNNASDTEAELRDEYFAPRSEYPKFESR